MSDWSQAANPAASIRDALAKSMVVRWHVRQLVGTVRKRWLETVFDSEFERPARDEYERLCAAHPMAYFELVAVATAEECVKFRPSREAAVAQPQDQAANVEGLAQMLDVWAAAAGTCFVDREGGPVSYGSLKREDLLKLMQLAQARARVRASGDGLEAPPGVEPG